MTFERYRNSLRLDCEQGEAAVLEVTPNVTWPDVVYYNSYTHPYMGWKINVVDNFNRRFSLPSHGVQPKSSGCSIVVAMALAVLFAAVMRS